MADPESGHTSGTANGQTRARVRVTSARPPKLSRRLYDIQAVLPWDSSIQRERADLERVFAVCPHRPTAVP